MEILIDIIFSIIIVSFLILQFLLFKKDRSKIRKMCNNYGNKEMTVRDLIRKLLEFNMDAKIEVNITGVPFYLNSDFSLCWDNFGDSCNSYEECLETKKIATDVIFDFTSSEK